MAQQGQNIAGVFENIAKRFREIIHDLLELDLDLETQLDRPKPLSMKVPAATMPPVAAKPFTVTLSPPCLMPPTLMPPRSCACKPTAALIPASYELIQLACEGQERVVIPGFYGQGPDGRVRCFSRGGSDITGAVVARALGADAYENWTDVSGVLMTDPRVVPEAPTISELTYAELRELSYMGASVLHEEAVFPAAAPAFQSRFATPTNPEAGGTHIVASRDTKDQVVTGIAGKPGFTTFYLEKAMMNGELGFGRRVLDVFERLGISYEHTPSGIDTMSIVVDEQSLGTQKDQVVADLQGAVHPDNIAVFAAWR